MRRLKKTKQNRSYKINFIESLRTPYLYCGQKNPDNLVLRLENEKQKWESGDSAVVQENGLLL